MCDNEDQQQQLQQQEVLMVVKTQSHDERIDGFWEHYRPYELTILDEHYAFNMPNSVRDFMPKYANSFSAFTLRVAPGRRQEEYGSSAAEANPNVSGKDSTSSTTSTGSEGSTSDSDGSEIEGTLSSTDDDRSSALRNKSTGLVSLKDLFSTMKQTYGVEICEPTEKNVAIYSRFVKIGDDAVKISAKQPTMNVSPLQREAGAYTESSFSARPPEVSQHSVSTYEQYVSRGVHGAGTPTDADLLTYQQYVSAK